MAMRARDYSAVDGAEPHLARRDPDCLATMILEMGAGAGERER